MKYIWLDSGRVTESNGIGLDRTVHQKIFHFFSKKFLSLENRIDVGRPPGHIAYNSSETNHTHMNDISFDRQFNSLSTDILKP